MLGVFAAITAAWSWTIACFIWRTHTKHFSSIQINILKNLIAALLFSPVILSIDWTNQFLSVLILIISGLIGIAFGDCLYIEALKKLGTRRTLTVEAFSPILANIFGAIMIGEILPLKVWLGGCIVTISLILVATQNRHEEQILEIGKRSRAKGFFLAFMSVICAVFAAILSRLVLTKTTFSPLQSTEIRLIGALMFLIPFSDLSLPRRAIKLPKKDQFSFLLATFLGTNCGIVLQQTAFKTLPIGLAWTLLSISPVISLIFAKFEGDPVDLKTVSYAAMSLLGVAIALL